MKGGTQKSQAAWCCLAAADDAMCEGSVMTAAQFRDVHSEIMLLDECRLQQPIPLPEPVSQVWTASRRRMNERTDSPKWPPSKTLSHLPPKLLELRRVSWILLQEMRGRTGTANCRSCWPQSATLSGSATFGDFHIWRRRMAEVRHST